MRKPIHGRGYEAPPTPQKLAYREARDAARAEIASFAAQIRAAHALQMRLVYGVLRAEAPVIKIGNSYSLASRLRKMSGGTLVALAHGGYEEERAVHERLAAHRVRVDLPGYGFTEHFVLCDEVVEWVNETRRAVDLDPVDLEGIMSHYM